MRALACERVKFVINTEREKQLIAPRASRAEWRKEQPSTREMGDAGALRKIRAAAAAAVHLFRPPASLSLSACIFGVEFSAYIPMPMRVFWVL